MTGTTGSGKTEVLRAATVIDDLLALDLEGAAEHRGSAFGATGPQPAQATFEHRLAVPLVVGRERRLLLEDESRNVGRVHLPAELHERVRSAPLLVLEEPLDALLRLRRRLGGDATDAMVAALRDARAQGAWHDPEAFRPVIEPLLHDYYDPAYRKATPTEGREVAARGDREELLAWLSATRRPSPA